MHDNWRGPPGRQTAPPCRQGARHSACALCGWWTAAAVVLAQGQLHPPEGQGGRPDSGRGSSAHGQLLEEPAEGQGGEARFWERQLCVRAIQVQSIDNCAAAATAGGTAVVPKPR
eukprot:1161625-Pelagomonas_calceolata.AAC.11